MLQDVLFQFQNTTMFRFQGNEYDVANRTKIMKIITVFEIVRNTSEGSYL